MKKSLSIVISSLGFLLSLQSNAHSQNSDGNGRVDVGFEPLQINIDPAELAKLPPEAQDLAKYVTLYVAQQIQRVANVQVEYPPSFFATNKPLINPQDEFILPTATAELRELAKNRLTPEMIQSIKEDGTFKVQSPSFPEHPHVFQVNAALQVGQKGISLAIQEDLANSVYQLTYKLPATLGGKDYLTVRNGLKQIVQAVVGTSLDLVIGIRKTIPKYNDYQIAQNLEKLRIAYITANIKDLAEKAKFTADLRLIPNGSSTDVKIRFAAATISNLQQKVATDWSQNAAKKAAQVDALAAPLKEKLKAGQITQQEYEQAYADLSVQTQNNELLDAIEKSKDLEALGTGIGKLAADNLRAVAIVQAETLKWTAELSAYSTDAKQRLTAKYPVRSKIKPWLDSQVENLTQAHADYTYDAVLVKNVIDQLAAQNLFQAAAIVQLDQAFTHPIDRSANPNGIPAGPAIEAEREMRAERAPVNRRFIDILRGYSPKDWISIGPDLKYYLAPYMQVEVNSNYPGWRLAEFFVRWKASIKNWSYDIVVRNLWNGPFGLRSLAGAGPFMPNWAVDPKTGYLYETGERGTMYSRIANIWKNVGINRDAFEAKAPGILGKGFGRLWNFTWNTLAYGVGGSTVVGVGQPLLTTLNFAGSAVGLGLSWLPIRSATLWALNAGVYDFERAPYSFESNSHIGGRFMSFVTRAVPALTEVAVPAAWGAGVTAVAGAKAASEGFEGLVSAAEAPLQWLVRGKIWEPSVRFVMAHNGYVPDSDSTMVTKRISGPGLAAENFFQVAPDLVLLTIRAQIEHNEANRLNQKANDLVSAPTFDYAKKVLSPLSLIVSLGRQDLPGEWSKKLEAQRLALAKSLTDNLSNSTQLLNIPQKTNIKLSTEDLRLVLKKGAAIAEAYYAPKMATWTPEERDAFWKSTSVGSSDPALTEGDWVGLAAKVLRSIYSTSILRPLEETDKTLVIHVNPLHLGEIADQLNKWTGPVDFEKFQVEDTIQYPSKNIPRSSVTKLINISNCVEALKLNARQIGSSLAYAR